MIMICVRVCDRLLHLYLEFFLLTRNILYMPHFSHNKFLNNFSRRHNNYYAENIINSN